MAAPGQARALAASVVAMIEAWPSVGAGGWSHGLPRRARRRLSVVAGIIAACTSLLAPPAQAAPEVAGRTAPTSDVRVIKNVAIRSGGSATFPPLLIVHGQEDRLVPWQQSQLLYGAVQRARGNARLVLIPRGEHGQWDEFFTDPAVDAGATVRRTHGCRSSRARPVGLSWSYVTHVFDRHLRSSRD